VVLHHKPGWCQRSSHRHRRSGSVSKQSNILFVNQSQVTGVQEKLRPTVSRWADARGRGTGIWVKWWGQWGKPKSQSNRFWKGCRAFSWPDDCLLGVPRALPEGLSPSLRCLRGWNRGAVTLDPPCPLVSLRCLTCIHSFTPTGFSSSGYWLLLSWPPNTVPPLGWLCFNRDGVTICCLLHSHIQVILHWDELSAVESHLLSTNIVFCYWLTGVYFYGIMTFSSFLELLGIFSLQYNQFIEATNILFSSLSLISLYSPGRYQNLYPPAPTSQVLEL
jgi:hypothetical protein